MITLVSFAKMMKYSKKSLTEVRDFSAQLIIFTFSCGFRFFLTFNTWFFVMLSLTDFLLDTCFRTASFESAKSAI